jgi:cytochrome P450
MRTAPTGWVLDGGRQNAMVATYDPFQVEQPERTFARLHELRSEGPIVPIGEGMFYVTSYEEARRVLRDAEHFSNAEGFRAPGVTVPAEDRMLGEQDAPQHPGVRRIVMSAFNPAAIRLEEEFVRRRARELLESVPTPGTVDMVPAFTTPLPNDATVHLLGFPMQDAPQIAAWSKEVMESEWPAMNRTERGEGMVGAFPEYTDYVDRFVVALRSAVASGTADDSLLARLITADVGGEALSARQMRALVFNLLLGGLTTTAQLLGNMIYQLLRGDSVGPLAAAGPDERAAFVEECLRVYPPVMLIPRGCVQETTVAGITIKPGERVIVGSACVNRDEALFNGSEEFDATRSNGDRHLTFGFGPHVCAGAAMARSVALIGLDEFLRFADGRNARLPAGFTYENVPTFFEYGPKTMPVTLDAPA